jgi:hypothetical protein
VANSFGDTYEYVLPYGKTFQENLEQQFLLRPKHWLGLQVHGNIWCYTTVTWDYGLLCLDWRNIRNQIIIPLNESVKTPIYSKLLIASYVDATICHSEESLAIHNKTITAPQYDKDCWKGSLTLNTKQSYGMIDICNISKQCISQYRIMDGTQNCMLGEDENRRIAPLNTCSSIQKYCFKCSDNEPPCNILFTVDDEDRSCLNNYNKFFYGSEIPVSAAQCNKRHDLGCLLLKNYMNNLSMVDSNETTISNSLIAIQNTYFVVLMPQLRFRSHWNTFWDLSTHADETVDHCREWICDREEYQCANTSQCIPVDWVCDNEWDYQDASDEQGLFIIKTLSPLEVCGTRFFWSRSRSSPGSSIFEQSRS